MPDVNGPRADEPDEPLAPSTQHDGDALAASAARSALVVALVVAAAVGPGLWREAGPRPTKVECSALVRRYVEHESHARNPTVRPAAVDTQLGSLAGRPVLRRQLEACEQALAPPQVDCALRAPNVDELERCLQ